MSDIVARTISPVFHYSTSPDFWEVNEQLYFEAQAIAELIATGKE